MLRVVLAVLGIETLLVVTVVTVAMALEDIRRGKVRPLTLILVAATVVAWVTLVMLALNIGHYWPNRRACIGDGYAW